MTSPIASLIGTYKSFVNGLRLIDGGELLSFAKSIQGAQSGLVALAGGGLSALTPQLNYGMNQISTCVTNADSVQLPPAVAGASVDLFNHGAADAAVFPAFGQGDSINASAANASVTQATGLSARYFCSVTGLWSRNLSA